MPTYVVDFDDLCDATRSELDILAELKRKHNALQCTLFTIPMRTNPHTIASVQHLNTIWGKKWLHLAPHGWRHTRGECLAWTSEETIDKLHLSRELGIDAPCFRAPGWLLESDVSDGCQQLNYTLASHIDHRAPVPNLREYIYNDPAHERKQLMTIHGHVTPVEGNYIKDMLKDGRLDFPADATFSTPWEVA
jgi:hypothetical protein